MGENPASSVAHSLAAQEVVHQLERLLSVPRGDLRDHLLQHSAKIKGLANEFHLLPYDAPLPGIRWSNLPRDPSFVSSSTTLREGHLQFFPDLRRTPPALLAAKAITLAASKAAPTVAVHTQALKTDPTRVQRFANVRAAGGPIPGVAGTVPGLELNYNLDQEQAQVVALIHLYNTLTHETTHKKWKKEVRQRNAAMMAAVAKERHSSYGMAKLYVAWPPHQFAGLSALLATCPDCAVPPPHRRSAAEARPRPRPRRDATRHEQRIRSFRNHQLLYPLPVDSIEKQIPHNDDASITIVRGGTGSGKVRCS
jgi:hypothetical protein